ncbi:putative exonuclease [Emericellopsis atlantica]|uniref:Exonuclease n=1 Tax=Emericellopsis atlantica TaxID=2614577 RepID=A0A9P8CL41_9HYPO|nr:putative exonuclease [Emericellopsis atlantica]KAG9251219.1 putative exonuclease [Emericellopsis atlantica]
MGVQGLLPLLKSIQRPTELKNFEGLTLGVDGYGWLHRAAYSCAVELGQGKPTTRYVTSALQRVRMLKHFGVKPYLVFDGDYLPSKAATEDSREKSRNDKKKLAMELLKAGKKALAAQEFQKCIDITPEMASNLIQQLKKMDIPYVVAPYEADAQLVYLERKGLIDGILSDDSDLLVFGAKRLLTKLDQYGHCIEINRRDFCACREVSLTGWTDQDFRRMAVLSGCDYTKGLPGVGLKTAYRLLRKSKTPERVVQMVQLGGKRVSENYLSEFYQAELTFLHQWVFCPEKRELVHLTDLDNRRTAEEMPYIGAYVEPSLARQIAEGDVDPITKTPIVTATTPSKRRHSQAAAATVPGPPPPKPITNYFKGNNRIPMGAMDPNCFKIDEQRLAQLTDGGSAPRVFPLPRPYLDTARPPTARQSTGGVPTRTSPRLQRRRTEPIQNMLASMEPAGRRPQPTKADGSTRPPKKARLCDDSNEQDDSPKQSKFFSVKKTSRHSHVSSEGTFEALMDLPDFEGFSSPDPKKKSISIYEEISPSKGKGKAEIPVKDDSQDSGISTSQETANSSMTEITFSQQPDSQDLPPSPTRSMPPPKRASRRHAASTPSRRSLNRYSFAPTPSDTPASDASRRSSIFSSVSTPATGPSTAGGSARLSALQRLGARALLPNTASPKPRESLIPKKKPTGEPAEPASFPLPKVDVVEIAALNRPTGGSEDQIIPNSDGEDEEDFESAPVSKPDFSRFAFTSA